MRDIYPDEFNDFIDDDLVLIDFHALWCGPCKMIAPHLMALSNTYGDRIKFGKFNIDSDKSIMQDYGVKGVPTLMFFSNGRPIGAALVGAHTKAQMEEFLAKHSSGAGGGVERDEEQRPPARPVDPRVVAAVPRRIPGWSRGRR